MRRCGACGKENRESANFCWNCATPLPVFQTKNSDQQWLEQSLTSTPDHATHNDITAPLNGPEVATLSRDAQEGMMHDENPPTRRLFAGRYELAADAAPGSVTALDTNPWRRCWACGSGGNDEGESYCMDCGAALEQRSYPAYLSQDGNLSGAALIPNLPTNLPHDLLPELIDQVHEGEETLTVLNESGRGAITPPIDEILALGVGASLAQLLVALHAEGLALGKLNPANLEALAAGKTRLRDAPGLRRVVVEEQSAAFQSDLSDLAELLEQLTATPRTTQRLDEDEAVVATDAESGSLMSVLREVRTGSLATATALYDRLQSIVDERTRPASLRQIVGAHTDVGIVRDHNEDSYLTLQLGLNNNNQAQGWGIYIVSDGMGGHAAGEVASSLAIRSAAELLISAYMATAVRPDTTYDEAQARTLVRQAIQQANEAIIAEGRSQGNDMGATITMALVSGDRAIIGNVGDSRTYLYRDGKLRRISKDHSLVMRLVELGQISDDEIYTHPQRNAVLRSLGDKSNVEVDIFSERLRPGDAILLCSDGQWEMTRDVEIERILSREANPQATCEALIAAANQAGGEDNIASVLVRFA
ncbi:protein phosphatase 2C-like protein [Oscillochloris trichoides DG-6]|uniref:Protein phosphatase 2C-like protein n=1 Tax=Oscillochloris trichoides DG-6 TaxID=765420 RepID=E1IH75_9CHLR|nr:Stp1/IreP family PP2C-type Ser/Thr phosphatase [Oscillochloris trichoides]EFO79550.1 protein phosphatase 2C-like protein [Oscillochloris trichoides DG-6]